MAPTDQLLVEKTLGGDRDAFADLVDRYVGLVHGVIAHRIRRPDEVEDLVQDVFFKAYQELPRLREPARFSSWLNRIATNRAQAWLRQRQAHKTTTSPDLDALGLPSGDGQERDLVEREAHAALWRAVDRLRPELRQVVILYHFEDCPQSDIARFLGISVPTVKWRLMRARKRLRRELERLEGAPPPAGLARHSAQREKQQRLRRGIMAALPAAFLARPRASSALSLGSLLAGRGWVAVAGGLGVAGALLMASDGLSAGPSTTADSGPLRVQVVVSAAAGTVGVEPAADSPGAMPPCAAGEVRRR